MSTRVISGIVGIVVAAATLSAVAGVALPTIEQRPASVTVTPVPTPARLVCPGAIRRLGEVGGEDAANAIAIGKPRYTTAATAGSILTTPLASTGSAAGGESSLVTADDPSAKIAAAQHQGVEIADFRGLAAAGCTAPSSDAWLVGGATTVGRTTLLTLANPGVAPSTVAIEIAGTDGPIDSPGLTGITVPASEQRTLSIAGFAPNVGALVVHVTSRGGPIAAALQLSIVRGIEPGGVDILGAAAVPNAQAVIPGVVVRGAEAVGARLGEEGFDDLLTTLRLYVPGDAEAQATVRIVPELDSSTGGSFQIALQPGVVTDVPIEDLGDGSYSVFIDSTEPLLAGVRAATVAGDAASAEGSGATDIGWFVAGTALAETAYASVAQGEGAQVHFANPGTADHTLTLNGQSVTVPAGGAVTIDAPGGETLVIEGAAGLFASVSFAGDGALASYGITSTANAERPVTVYP